MNSSNPFILPQDLTLALFVHGPVEAAARFLHRMSVEQFFSDPEPLHCNLWQEDRQIIQPPTVNICEVPAFGSAVQTPVAARGEIADIKPSEMNEPRWLQKTFSGKATRFPPCLP